VGDPASDGDPWTALIRDGQALGCHDLLIPRVELAEPALINRPREEVVNRWAARTSANYAEKQTRNIRSRMADGIRQYVGALYYRNILAKRLEDESILQAWKFDDIDIIQHLRCAIYIALCVLKLDRKSPQLKARIQEVAGEEKKIREVVIDMRIEVSNIWEEYGMGTMW
jgi:hypothetical protein